MKRHVVWSDEARSDYLAIIRHIARYMLTRLQHRQTKNIFR